MSNSYGVNPTSGTGPTMAWGATYLSPDALLVFCQEQLGGLDHEIKTQMDSQKMQLRERAAVETVQGALEQFGTAGPQNATQVTACVSAFDNAIASLPADDPVAAQLQQKCQQIKDDFGYKPGEITPLVLPNGSVLSDRNVTLPTISKHLADGAWKGTTDDLTSLAGDIRSNAEIDLLKLQDLVSQRQQTVQLASGMLSKEDQTLEAQAKALGQ
jgi:hypothetical protein